MKKFLIAFFITTFSCVFAQNVNNTEKKSITSDSIYTKVDKAAEYPGGMNAFRTNFMNTFKMNVVKGVSKSEVKFVISEKGEIIDIVATGNNPDMNKEMIRTIKKLSVTKWTPGEINGIPVKSRYRLPLTLQDY
jgi:protein TonB